MQLVYFFWRVLVFFNLCGCKNAVARVWPFDCFILCARHTWLMLIEISGIGGWNFFWRDKLFVVWKDCLAVDESKIEVSLHFSLGWNSFSHIYVCIDLEGVWMWKHGQTLEGALRFLPYVFLIREQHRSSSVKKGDYLGLQRSLFFGISGAFWCFIWLETLW